MDSKYRLHYPEVYEGLAVQEDYLVRILNDSKKINIIVGLLDNRYKAD